MKNPVKYVLIFIVLVVVSIIFYVVNLYNSFENLVLDRMNESEITSIEMGRSESLDKENIVVTDPLVIEQIMNDFSGIKLRKSSAFDISTKSYVIDIKVNKSSRFGIRLDDNKYISIIDLDRDDKYRTGTYKITSKFDGECIQNLFK